MDSWNSYSGDERVRSRRRYSPNIQILESRGALVVLERVPLSFPTLVAAASCRRRVHEVFLVRTFPFLRHLLSGASLSTAQLTSAGCVGHLQPAGYTTHRTVCGRRVEKCEWISVPFIQIPSSVVLALCAQSYHMVGSRASGEARSRSPLRLPGGPSLISLNKWEIFAVEVISRPRAPRIISESRSDGNCELAATCWCVTQWRVCVCVVTPGVFESQFRFPTLHTVCVCVSPERGWRRQTPSLIRRGWRTAGTKGALGCLGWYTPM